MYYRDTIDIVMLNLRYIEMMIVVLSLSSSTKGRQPVSDDKRLMGKHFAYKSSKRGRHCVCSYKIPAGGMKRDKKNYCKKCEVHLCVGMCFELYHTRTAY